MYVRAVAESVHCHSERSEESGTAYRDPHLHPVRAASPPGRDGLRRRCRCHFVRGDTDSRV